MSEEERGRPARDGAGSDPGSTPVVGEPISIRSVGMGAAWNVVASVLPQGLTLVQSLVVGRLLGPHDQGIQSFMIFVAVTCATVFAVGLPLALQRGVSEALGAGSAPRASYLLRYGIGLSSLPGLAAAGVTLLVGCFIYQDHGISWVTAAVYAAAVAVHAVSSQALLGLRQYRQASITGVAAQIIAVPLTVWLLLIGYGIQAIMTVTAAAAVISCIVTIWLVSRARRRYGLVGAPAPGQRPRVRRTLLSFALGAGVLTLLETVVAQRSELAFLAIYHGDEPANIAYYSVAFSATQTAYRVPAALIPVVLPTVTAMIAAGRIAAVRRGYAQAQRMLLTVSAIGAGYLLGMGAPLITALWGPSYRPAGQTLLIMAAAPVLFGALTSVASSTLLGAGRLGLVVRAQLIAAALTLVCDAVLIGPLDIYGAALANSLGALVSAALLARAARRAEGLMHPTGSDLGLAVALLAGICAPGLVLHLLAVESWTGLAGAFLGGTALLLILWPLIRPLREEDLSIAHRLLARLPGPARRWLVAGTRRGGPAHRGTSRMRSAAAPTTTIPATQRHSVTAPAHSVTAPIHIVTAPIESPALQAVLPSVQTDRAASRAERIDDADSTAIAGTDTEPTATDSTTQETSIMPQTISPASDTERTPKKPRPRSVIIGAVIGLLVGLLGGIIVDATTTQTYISSTTYGLGPVEQAQSGDEASAAAQRSQTELAQLGFLAPVISGKASDSDLRKKIDQELGRSTDAEIIPSLIPDSNLIFQVQVRAGDPQDAYDTARALQKLLPADETNASMLKAADAKLLIVSTATQAENSSSIPPVVIKLGSAAAGTLLGAAVVMIYGQRRRPARA